MLTTALRPEGSTALGARQGLTPLSTWVAHEGHPFSRSSSELGRGGAGSRQRRGLPRNTFLWATGPALPKSSGPGAQVLAASEVWAPSGRGRGSGCACRRGRQGAAASSGRRRKSRGAGDRGSGGPSRRRLCIRELRGADPGASEPRRRRPSGPADRTRVGTAISPACGASAAAVASQPRGAGRKGGGGRRRGATPRAGLNNGARRSGDPRVRPTAVEEAAGRRPPPALLALLALLARVCTAGLAGWGSRSPAPKAAQPGAWCRRPARPVRSDRSSPSSSRSSRPSRPSRGCCLWLLCEREYNSSASPRRVAGDHPTRTCPLKASPGTAGECPPRADSRRTKRS